MFDIFCIPAEHLSINRIRLEFKVIKEPFNINTKSVLIESDWNLKEETIEEDERLESRINRIRLEFKVRVPFSFITATFSVLIESDWNLKTVLEILDTKPVMSINRIRLEFKG